MSDRKTYLILEEGTGLIDGWYFGWKDNAEGMVNHWNETRPMFKHIAVQVVDGDTWHLSDHQLMNEYCDAPAGGNCTCWPGKPARYRCGGKPEAVK